jgi:phage terminase small subunit
MSRKSLAAVTTVAVLPGQRPEPPEYLGDGEAAIWRELVATKPHDWFVGSLQHLATYCQLCIAWQEYHAQRNAFRTDPHDDFETQMGKCNARANIDDILRKTVASINVTATKLRLCPSSRERADHAAVAHNSTAKKKLWETA